MVRVRRSRGGERGVHPLHADHAGAIEAEFAQHPEDRIRGAVADVELDRVAVGPTRGSGPHHHVLDAGGGGEPVGQRSGKGRWAHHAHVQHHEPPGAGPSRT
jgi:hypothetical protein